MDGKYLYDTTLPLIDYCGDIRQKRTQYSKNFSPNNIRRLYISPDGAIVTYHIPVNGGITRSVRYDTQKFNECKMCLDYVPIINVLSAERICSSIEEVVICSVGSSGASLDMRDMDFRGLIKSYKGGGGDIKSTIMNRYTRLHSFIVYNGTLQGFMELTKMANKATSVLTSTGIVRTGACNVEIFHQYDWYNNYSSNAQFYMLDAAGSPLNEHFLKVKNAFTSRAKEDDIERFKNEKVKGLKEEFQSVYEQCIQLMRCYTKLYKMQKESGDSVLGVSLPNPTVLELRKVNGLGRTHGLIKLIEPASSIKETYEFNIESCNNYRRDFYTELVKCLLEGLITLNNRYPIMVSTILNNYDRAINVPTNLQSLNSQLPKQLDGKRFVDSLANASIMLGVLSIAYFKDTEKEVWLKCMR